MNSFYYIVCYPSLFPCSLLTALLAVSMSMQVWEHAGPGYISWDASDVGRDYMGVVVENRMLQAELLRAATAAPGSCVELLHPVKVKALDLPGVNSQSKSTTKLTIHKGTSSSSSVSASSRTSSSSSSSGQDSSNKLAAVHLDDGRVLRCRLVVGADGARSQVSIC